MLLNNALFGKTMENVRSRKKFNLRNSDESLFKDTSKAHNLSSHRFAEDLVLTELMNLEVKLNKPIFIGQAVLDISKLIMFELRYHKFPQYEAEFNGSITVVGGDTDSLFCYIENISLNEQLHPAMARDGLLDSSNFPSSHPLYSVTNKAKLGCIKDEMSGNVLREAVLLKPKCYSMLAVSGAEKKTAKGLQYCVRQRLSHTKYFEVYNRQLELVRNVRRFQSTDHVVNTIEQQKWCLSITDTKRA